jgi:exodeoxyribonuclease V alpha subunit
MHTEKNKMLAALQARAAKIAAQNVVAGVKEQFELSHAPITTPEPELEPGVFRFNAKQLEAVNLAGQLQSFCLIGAAGTGKTTTLKAALKKVMEKLADSEGNVSVRQLALIAYTRRAVRNIAKAVQDIGASKFCCTAHALLEYQPNRDGYYDKDGEWKSTMRFEPTITASRPNLDMRFIAIDEASMLSYKGLYAELVAGFPNATFIFIGDLNQLPPVFGDAVLGYKLAELPVVELTEVYRQAMDSPIIAFQHKYTLKGVQPLTGELEHYTSNSTPDKGLEFVPFRQPVQDNELLCMIIANYMFKQLEAGLYDPEQDTILIPFAKAFGSTGVNLQLAEHLAKKNELKVHEVIAGFEKKYLAVSDFVMYEKQECRITNIELNPKYFGAQPQPASTNLNRYGYLRNMQLQELNLEQTGEVVWRSIEDILENTAAGGDGEKSQASSHKVTLEVIGDENGKTYELSSVGEIRGIDFGYCMTIHKAQGSEWRKVWCVFHRNHATMLSRELLYTGMTRAKEKLTILYSPATATGRKDSTIFKCINKAVISGIGWKNKIEYFIKSKEEMADAPD